MSLACDMTDPELRRVFEAIHSDIEVTNWMICGYATVSAPIPVCACRDLWIHTLWVHAQDHTLEVVASGNDAIKVRSCCCFVCQCVCVVCVPFCVCDLQASACICVPYNCYWFSPHWQALSYPSTLRVPGSIFPHLSHCGTKPLYVYLRINGLPRASTVTTNALLQADAAVSHGYWGLKGPDCSST